jgi:hypothetical protein
VGTRRQRGDVHEHWTCDGRSNGWPPQSSSAECACVKKAEQRDAVHAAWLANVRSMARGECALARPWLATDLVTQQTDLQSSATVRAFLETQRRPSRLFATITTQAWLWRTGATCSVRRSTCVDTAMEERYVCLVYCVTSSPLCRPFPFRILCNTIYSHIRGCTTHVHIRGQRCHLANSRHAYTKAIVILKCTAIRLQIACSDLLLF